MERTCRNSLVLVHDYRKNTVQRRIVAAVAAGHPLMSGLSDGTPVGGAGSALAVVAGSAFGVVTSSVLPSVTGGTVGSVSTSLAV